MSKYQFGSIVDRDFRNTLQRLADDAAAQGKALQDLVAEGQLTPSQYATLISVVNSNIKNGEVSVHDIDKNKGKFDQTYLTQDLIDAIAGAPGANILSEVAPNSVTNDKLASQAVTADKTDFLMNEESNLFNGFINAVFTYEGSEGPDRIFFLTSKYDNPSPHIGSLVIFPLKHNTTYSITFHDAHNQFRLAKVDNYPDIPQGYDKYNISSDDVLVNNGNLNTFNFDSGGSNFGILYASSIGQKPRIQINEGADSSVYRNPFTLKSDYLDDEMVRRKVNNIVFEDAKDGYPERPDFPSVIYYGVNEPTDVEPFDEWRETEGFTYFTNFVEYLVGEEPSDWTDILAPFRSKQITKVGGKKALQLHSDATTGLLWSAIQPELDNEIYFKMQYSSETDYTAQILSAMHRVVSSAEGDGYMFVGILGDNLRVARKQPSASSTTELATAIHNIDPRQPYHQASRIDGGRIRAKIWQDGQPEPKDWLIDVDDSNPLESSEGIGFYNFVQSRYYNVYQFGVGTGGMRAPRRKVL